MSPGAHSLNRTVCVSNCPLGNESSLSCHPNSVIDSCVAQAYRNNASQGVWIYSSEPVLGKLCAPLNISEFPSFENYSNTINEYGDRLSDLKSTWMIVTASAFLALFIGYIHYSLLIIIEIGLFT